MRNKVIAAIAVLVVGGSCNHPPEPRAPDVLLVVMDTVRADRLSAYGYGRATSRQLEGLARAGVRFSDVTASGSWTWPSHGALFTGRPPWETGAHASYDPETQKSGVSTIQEGMPTLAERLSAAGYRSLAYASNGWLSAELGLSRGFEQVEVYNGRDGDTIQAAIAAMNTEREQPLFLFVNLLQAHAPFMAVDGVPWSQQHVPALREPAPWLQPLVEVQESGIGVGLTKEVESRASNGDYTLPPEGRAMLTDLYDGGLVALDNAMYQLIGAWIASGRDKEVLVVTSDHGELLGEHGLLQHGGTCYTELLSVPLVMAAPGRLPMNQNVSTPVQLRDVMPTLLDLTGVAPGAEGSLLPVIQGSSRSGPITARAWPYTQADRGPLSTGWRYYREHPMVVLVPDTGASELYDLSADPMMTANLAAEQPELTARLSAAARTHIPDGPATPMADELSPTLRANLEALGYLE